MSPEQLRMARAAVRLGVRELATEAGVSFTTVSRFETGKSGLQHSSAEALRRALEARGIQFLENGQVAEGNGVAIRRLDAGGTLDDT
ncbi:helix-turn-helix domain-containing protein [Roseivivax sediminis]|uniref:helix-turn-helix domain-containing protein n=1 Tax=Roseivivax sediminis TaxID=936889 RepID=UPI001CB753D3|nr:helix-turn-helix transcriptional regulator [Roseivivax sediminis]